MSRHLFYTWLGVIIDDLGVVSDDSYKDIYYIGVLYIVIDDWGVINDDLR